MPLKISTEVNQNSTCKLKFRLVDFDGVGIGASSITTATMSLYDRETKTVINNRTAVNVKPYFDGSGNFLFTLTNLDNALVNDAVRGPEIHLAIITVVCTVGAETVTLVETIEIKVNNLLIV